MDDHQRYSVKELSINILMKKEHKILQNEASEILIKIFNTLNNELVPQLSFISDFIEEIFHRINEIQIEIAQQKYSGGKKLITEYI
jgi:glutathionyl-hydroquinone reductase